MKIDWTNKYVSNPNFYTGGVKGWNKPEWTPPPKVVIPPLEILTDTLPLTLIGPEDVTWEPNARFSAISGIPPYTFSFTQIPPGGSGGVITTTVNFTDGIPSNFVLAGNLFFGLDSTRYHSAPSSAATLSTLADSQYSSMTLTETFAEGPISFWFSVSAELDYDGIKFFVDGVNQAPLNVDTGIYAWTGEIPWTYFEYQLTAGEHVIEWRFEKDSEVSELNNMGWVDDITYSVPGESSPIMTQINTLDTTTIGTILNNRHKSFTVTVTDSSGDQAEVETIIHPAPLQLLGPDFIYGDTATYQIIGGFYPYEITAVQSPAPYTPARFITFENPADFDFVFSEDGGWYQGSNAYVGSNCICTDYEDGYASCEFTDTFAAGTVSFWHSGEGSRYSNGLRIYVDGEDVSPPNTVYPSLGTGWSNDWAWQQFSFDVTAGEHTILFESDRYGATYIDNIYYKTPGIEISAVETVINPDLSVTVSGISIKNNGTLDLTVTDGLDNTATKHTQINIIERNRLLKEDGSGIKQESGSAINVEYREVLAPGTPYQLFWHDHTMMDINDPLIANDATASIPGTFNYNTEPPYAIGTYTLTAYFTPEDSITYLPSQIESTLTIVPEVDLDTWLDVTHKDYWTEVTTTRWNGVQWNLLGSFNSQFLIRPSAAVYGNWNNNVSKIRITVTNADGQLTDWQGSVLSDNSAGSNNKEQALFSNYEAAYGSGYPSSVYGYPWLSGQRKKFTMVYPDMYSFFKGFYTINRSYNGIPITIAKIEVVQTAPAPKPWVDMRTIGMDWLTGCEWDGTKYVTTLALAQAGGWGSGTVNNQFDSFMFMAFSNFYGIRNMEKVVVNYTNSSPKQVYLQLSFNGYSTAYVPYTSGTELIIANQPAKFNTALPNMVGTFTTVCLGYFANDFKPEGSSFNQQEWFDILKNLAVTSISLQ